VGNTILLSSEEVPEYVIRPRLDSLKGDPRRIMTLEAVATEKDGQKWFDLKNDMERLRKFIEEVKAVLVVVDPLNNYLGPSLDTYKDHHVRAVLTPLAKVAEETGVVMLGLIHLNKDSEKPALHRIMNSVAFTAVSRVVLAVANDPEEEGSRLFGGLKSNIGPIPSTLQYYIDEEGLHWNESGPVDRGMDRAIRDTPEVPSTREMEAREFIREVLPPGRRMQTKELDKLARQSGYTGGTWQRAKQKEGVRWAHNTGIDPPIRVSFRE
jgi:hypothetical protein